MVVNVMQQSNKAWIAMIRRIPGDMHDTLALGLRTGAEVVLQKLIKLEPDFMVIRGRVSGTSDPGRIILIPYGELSFVSSTRLLKDTQIEAIFGKESSLPMAASVLPSSAADEANATLDELPEVEESLTEDRSETANAPKKKPEGVSKTVLLAKLRERMKETK
jgi:hypothetical protein